MKTLRRILFATTALLLFATVDSNAQIIVRSRPYHHGPVVIRPNRPSPRHVWIGNEWTVRRGGYIERPGYWAVPPRPRAVWMPGRWDHRPGGYIWISGYWR